MDYGYGYVRRGSKSMYNSRIMNCALCFSFGATSVSHIPDTLPRSFQISAEFFLFSTNLMCLELIAREQKSQVGKIWKLSKTMICSSSDIWNCGDCWYGRFWMGAHNAGAKKSLSGPKGGFLLLLKIQNRRKSTIHFTLFEQSFIHQLSVEYVRNVVSLVQNSFPIRWFHFFLPMYDICVKYIFKCASISRSGSGSWVGRS